MSQKLQVHLKHNKSLLISDCSLANTSWKRLVGLLQHKELQESQALLIQPCKQVHTCFMRFPIDAVFLDKNNRVLGVSSLKPWRLSKLHWTADKVLETPFGFCERHQVRAGTELEFVAC